MSSEAKVNVPNFRNQRSGGTVITKYVEMQNTNIVKEIQTLPVL